MNDDDENVLLVVKCVKICDVDDCEDDVEFIDDVCVDEG